MTTSGPAMADTLGTDGLYADPLWRVRVALTPLELDLLRCAPVRRLAFVGFAGASAAASTQSGSRLEHSLGLLALTAHFAPGETVARAAALLHDVGHLPFSHSLEGLHGVDHHALGATRIHDLDRLLRRHGTSAAEIAGVLDGTVPSVLTAPVGVLKLDHLDGLVRSATSHGRTYRSAPELLARLTLVAAGVSTDAVTAHEIAAVVADEARLHTAPLNVAADAALGNLVMRWTAAAGVAFETVAACTDDEIWAALLNHPATAADTRLLRLDPTAWRIVDPATDPGPEVLAVVVRRLYLNLPLIDGRRMSSAPPEFADLPATPVRFAVRRPATP